MSKRVEVREGDTWWVFNGSLRQRRGEQNRHIASDSLADFPWVPISQRTMNEATKIGNTVARAWIESLGGEWAEVAEEKPVTVVVVDYMHENGTIWRAAGGSRDHKEMEAQIASGRSLFRRITIAGVTT